MWWGFPFIYYASVNTEGDVQIFVPLINSFLCPTEESVRTLAEEESNLLTGSLSRSASQRHLLVRFFTGRFYSI